MSRERTALERQMRLLKPGRRHAFYLSQRLLGQPKPRRIGVPVEPMTTVVRQGHYAAQLRRAMTPGQRRRVRKKQNRLLRL